MDGFLHNKKHDYFLKTALEEAFEGMRNNDGGPFGAVVVLDDKIIGKGHNMVTSQNDPTAHAEVVAIRNACKALGNFHLNEAVLYTSCEPCPMCMSAIYWANIKKVYYFYTKEDAENIGFSDKFIYQELEKPIEKRTIEMKKMELDFPVDLFKEWSEKQDKTEY